MKTAKTLREKSPDMMAMSTMFRALIAVISRRGYSGYLIPRLSNVLPISPWLGVEGFALSASQALECDKL